MVACFSGAERTAAPARSALPCRWTVRGNRSFRKEERDREAEPPIGSALRALRVIASAELELDRQPSDLHELAHEHVDGHRPLAILPVVGRFGVQPERRVRRCRKGDEWLEEHAADIRAIVVTGKRPDVVGQETISPTTFLSQDDGRWARPPFP